MHVPDGFLNAKVLGLSAGLAAAGVGAAVLRTRGMERRKVPLLGLSAAFIFAGQMLNFPVAGGTSGHLIGGVLAAVLLGPSAAVLALTAVLIIQCFVFADGGVWALGANVLNMGVVDAVAGYYVYRAVAALTSSRRGRLAAVAAGAWVGTVLAAVVCSGMLVMSGAARAAVILPAMLGVHALIGIGEATITVIVVSAVWKARPEIILRDTRPATTPAPRAGAWEFAGYGLLVALALAVFVAPLASNAPDGLDKVAADHGVRSRETPVLKSPLAEYRMPGIAREHVATAAAGLAGTLVVFGVALVVAKSLARRRGETTSVDTDAEPISGTAG